MTTDNRTNEQIVAEALDEVWNFSTFSDAMEAAEVATTSLATAGRLAGELTQAQVEAAAKAIADNLFPNWSLFSRARASKDRGSLIHVAARAALVAAQGAAPQVPSEDRAMEIAQALARAHMFTSVDALSIANAALALAAPALPSSTVDEGKLEAALRVALDDSDAMHCTRAWSAWGYGTMTSTDFVPVTEDQDAMDELVRAVVEAIGGEGR